MLVKNETSWGVSFMGVFMCMYRYFVFVACGMRII